MSNLQALLEAIDRLPPDELEQVHEHVEERRALQRQIADESVEERIAALHQATDNFWEGFSDAEIDEIVADMNSEYN